MRRRESSIKRTSFFLLREERFPRLRIVIHALFLPTKKAIENLENLNKNAEVSVPQGSPLSLFFS